MLVIETMNFGVVPKILRIIELISVVVLIIIPNFAKFNAS
jgi:competence protein ComGC